MPGGHTSTTLGKGGGGGGDRARPLLDCFEHFFFLFPSFRFLKSFTTSHTLFLTFLGFSLFLTFPSPSFSPLPSSYTFVSASTTSDKTGEEGLSSSASSPSLPDKTDLCQLTGIDLSSGRLPNFDVHTLEYTVNLTTQQSEIILLPRFQCPRDIPSHLLPSVTVEGQHVDIFTPLGVKLDLDPNQKWRTLHMSIRNPGNSKADTLDYRFHINQQNAVKAEPQLEKIFFRDSRGKLLQPVRLFEKSNDVFTLASGPDDTYVQLEAHCDPSSSMYINGSRMLFGSSVKISREEDQPNSMVTVECRRTSGGQLEGDIQRRAHFFNVLWTRINLPLPYKLIMHSTASSCEIIPEEDSRILCKNEGSFASLFSLFSPSIMYKVTTTTEDETDSFLLPLINGGWTPRFPLREDLRLVATAGDAQTSWKLDFMTIFPLPSSIPSWVQSIQEYSALCLLISVVIISSLLLLAVLTAQGSPRKFSEAPSIALFFFQIALFLQLLKGGGSGKGVLETTGSPFLRLTSLFLPLPPYTVKSNVQLAGGCLVSSLVILGIVAFLRIFFITTLHQQRSSQKAKERESRQHPGSKASSLSSLVLPHNLNFGNVENRLLFVLAFPICASSAILIAEGDSPWLSRMIGITVLSFMTMYWIGIYYKVRQYVKTDQVTWVWNCPLMDGTDDRAGYWCDRVCDQLQSEPINWTVCQCTPAGKWLAPAARIAAVALDEQGLQSAGIGDSSSTYEAEKQQLREELWFLRHDAPVGSTAVDVDAIDSYHGHATTTATTLVPCVRDLSIGIVRFEWLDILFSVHTLNAVLTHLKQSFLTRTGFTLPLTVKLNQLSGPITSGSLGLFFELRTPCARIFEGITRSLLGVMLGLAFSFSNYTSIHYAHSSSLLLTFLASLSLFIWIFYLYYDKPFHREAENFFFPLIFGVLGFNAFLHSIRLTSTVFHKLLSLEYIFDRLCCMSMLGLSVYVTFIVTLTLLLGLIWPAMHEVRFLSRLCNTSLIITDRLRNFIVTCPAYNRFGAKNLTLACVECPSGGGSASHATAENLDGNLYPQSQVQVHEISPSPSAESYARLEVSMHDLVEGCVTGHLGRPHACIFIENSSVGEFHFRSLRLYKEDDTAQEIDGFLAEDPVTANAGPLLSSILLSHVEEGKKTGGEITTISVEAQPFAEQSSSYFCFRRDPHHSRRLDRGGAPAEVGSEYVDQISWDLACRPIPHCIQPAETPLLEKSSCRPPSADTICPSPLGTRSLC